MRNFRKDQTIFIIKYVFPQLVSDVLTYFLAHLHGFFLRTVWIYYEQPALEPKDTWRSSIAVRIKLLFTGMHIFMH